MYKEIRKLARDWKFQTLYIGNNKTLPFIQNKKHLNKLQFHFLYWLLRYNGLYETLSFGEEFLTEAVLNDEMRTDAYLYYAKIKNEQETMERILSDKKGKFNHKEIDMTAPEAFSFEMKKPDKK